MELNAPSSGTWIALSLLDYLNSGGTVNNSTSQDKGKDRAAGAQQPTEPKGEERMSDDEAQRALDRGDSDKIDRKLAELHVSTTASGKDQTQKPDTEGSNSSSKNCDEQNE
jgi:hypothetical protein